MFCSYTGWHRKNATPTINNSKKTRDRMKKAGALMHIKFFLQQYDTKIINFDEGVLILWLFFWGNVIFKICHSCLKRHNWRTENFHCLTSPGKASALALKSEDSMKIEKHSLRNFAMLQSEGATQRNSSVPQLWQRSIFRKLHWLWKMALESKRFHQNYWSWCHFAGKRMYYALIHSLIWFSPWFLWN